MLSVNHIEASELASELGSDDILLVDVRTEAETRQGVIPGARLLPLHLLPMHLDALRDSPARVVIYCQSGARSAQACSFLQGQGMGEVLNLSGGIMAWVSGGHQVELPADDASLVA